MDISHIPAKQRFGIGLGLTIGSQLMIEFGSAYIGPSLGVVTRLAGVTVLFGVVFFGVALEPSLTRRLGGETWNDLSFVRQTAALFVMAISAMFLYAVVTIGGGALTRLLV